MLILRPAWFQYSISNLKRTKHKNAYSVENFHMTWWTWYEMLSYVLAKAYERMPTCSLTERVLDGWTSEVFQPLFLDKVNKEKLSVSYEINNWVAGRIRLAAHWRHHQPLLESWQDWNRADSAIRRLVAPRFSSYGCSQSCSLHGMCSYIQQKPRGLIIHSSA